MRNAGCFTFVGVGMVLAAVGVLVITVLPDMLAGWQSLERLVAALSG